MTRGRVARSNGLRVHFALNGLPHSRYGISATTAVGGAVVRNRVRRWGRELLRRWDELLAPGYDLIVFVNNREAAQSFAHFANHLAASLHKAELTESELAAG